MIVVNARRALFLDRDGVINRHHAQGFVANVEDWQWLPDLESVARAIRLAKDHNCLVFVVTNQSGVGLGLYSKAQMQAVHSHMRTQLAQHNADIDDLRYSLFHPDAKDPEMQSNPDWRKPNPGMILDLYHSHNVDLPSSLLIGDKATDRQAASAAGCQFRKRGSGHLADDLTDWL